MCGKGATKTKLSTNPPFLDRGVKGVVIDLCYHDSEMGQTLLDIGADRIEEKNQRGFFSFRV